MIILSTILVFLLTISIIVIFHEYGHYIAARMCGIKVLQFSVGFGKKIASFKFRNSETEFKICALPLGGYVKMLDENEGKVSESDKKFAFNNQPLFKRAFVVANGPIFNFILAFFFYFLILYIGSPGLKPVVYDVVENSIVEDIGLQANDEIISINDSKTLSWSSVIREIINNIADNKNIEIQIKRNFQEQSLDPIQSSSKFLNSQNILNDFGIYPVSGNSNYVGSISKASLAEKYGILQNDQIISINDKETLTWEDIINSIANNKNNNMVFLILRNGENISLNIPTQSIMENNQMVGKIGIGPMIDQDFVDKNTIYINHDFLESIKLSIYKTYDMSILTLKFLKMMVTGKVSSENISGPIGIAQYAKDSFDIGLMSFLSLLAILSISIGILNLLPIPMLDGGHLLNYFFEFILRRPLSEGMQIHLQKIGLIFIIFLTFFAFYNDISKLIT